MGRDIFVREALYSHGSMARRILLPAREVENADYTAINEFSCNRRVLEQSIGIISHSTYHLSIFEQFYPEGILTPHRIIPHCRDIVQKINVGEMANIKSKLHIATDAFIIASFGHITYTKCCGIILRAFINNKHLIQNPKIYLIFVGSVNNDDYGVRFNAEIEKNNMNEKIIVTGYVTDSDFQDYLKITDIAVQLRGNSRGETSGATLYALSHGIPVIVNNYAIFATDYPEDVVYKLSEHPESEELGNCLEKLYSDAELRSELSRKGREFVRRNNDPRACAALYAAAIHEFYDKSRCANVNSHIKELSYNTKVKEDTFNYIQYISNIKNIY
jgi:glycosyltransferase involved in cell wall biosynthesis